MKQVFLNVTYRHGRPITAYLHLPRLAGDAAARAERIDDVLLIDRAADGRPIGVEITDPGRFDPERFFTLLASLGQPTLGRRFDEVEVEHRVQGDDHDHDEAAPDADGGMRFLLPPTRGSMPGEDDGSTRGRRGGAAARWIQELMRGT